MKVIVTGSTGNIGGAVLTRCLEHPQITSIIALTRRPLDVKDPKLTNIVHKDFLKYDESTLSQLSGAQACIWALGAPSSGPEVHSGYTWAAVDAFKTSLVPHLGPGKPFRFIYTSGGLIPYLDSPILFFLGPKRKYRGDIERDLCNLNTEMGGKWETVSVRPWFVIEGDKPSMMQRYLGAYIPREELAAAMLDAALNGSEKQILENADCREKGQGALTDGKVNDLSHIKTEQHNNGPRWSLEWISWAVRQGTVSMQQDPLRLLSGVKTV